MKTLFTPRNSIGLVVPLCLVALAAVWLANSAPPSVAASQASAFIQSGGVTSDVLPSASDTTELYGHAAAPGVRRTATPPTF